jgi:Dyp-type peroxidase family
MRTPDLDNIQGHPLFGFNTRLQRFLGFKLAETASLDDARGFMAYLSGAVASASQVRAERMAIRDSALNGDIHWLCAALGIRLAQALRPDQKFSSVAFRFGFLERSNVVMGDHTNTDDWKLGGSVSTKPDVFCIVAANSDPAIASARSALIAKAADFGFLLIYEDLGTRLDGEKEHFGFRDGIAQPRPNLEGQIDDAPLGQFITGYPDRSHELSNPIFVGPDSDIAHDGSFLKFRRLRQKVGQFRAFVAAQHARLALDWPDLTTDHLAALVVGRWPDGQLVDTRVGTQPASVAPELLDDFDFDDDRQGLGCPFTAHIRKVNPRNGGGDENEPQLRRFLRRGIPFGDALPSSVEDDGADRGLLFVAFQASIDDTVDFVTQKWMNNDSKPNLGNDLLVGRGFGANGGTLGLERDGKTFSVQTQNNDWIVPNGGGYFYCPSVRGFGAYATPPAGQVAWRIRSFIGAAGLKASDIIAGRAMR